MAWYEDLSNLGDSPYEENNYFRVWHPSLLRAVGWLERGQPYPRGTVDHQVVTKLTELLKDAWQPVIFMGGHDCDLCLNDGKYGYRNLFIPGDESLFVSPELILHYITGHDYSPLGEFCKAVLACPLMGSTKYMEAAEPLWRRAKTK